MAGQDEVLAFIRDTFRSAWGLELLRHLVRSGSKSHSQAELIEALRASNAAISQSMATLDAAALIATADDGGIRFQPASKDLEQLALAAIALFESRPDLVRRTIVSRTAPGITAFADAFKLRKD